MKRRISPKLFSRNFLSHRNGKVFASSELSSIKLTFNELLCQLRQASCYCK